jgi:hypothetical protein
MKARTVLLLLLIIVYYAGIALGMMPIAQAQGHKASATSNTPASARAINEEVGNQRRRNRPPPHPLFGYAGSIARTWLRHR